MRFGYQWSYVLINTDETDSSLSKRFEIGESPPFLFLMTLTAYYQYKKNQNSTVQIRI